MLQLVFFASRTLWLCSASLLPAATRPGCLAADFVFGTSEITRSGVANVTVSSGIASSICVVIMYI